MMDNTIERRTNNLTHVETMFDARRTPWDGLGKRIAGAVTSRDAIRLAGLDWNVVPTDIISEATGLKIPGYKANVRDLDDKVLGVVTDRYKVVQNDEAFAFTDTLLGEGVRYETAGSLQEGRRVWMLARMPREFIIGGERISPYMVFSNTHDGSGAVKTALTPIRVVCNNTLNLALRTAKRSWSMIHTGDISGKIEEAKNTLLLADEYMTALGQEFENLRKIKLSEKQVLDYIKILLPMEENYSLLQKRGVEKLRADMKMRYFDAPDLKDVGNNGYRFVNAVSDFATHSTPRRKTANYKENIFARTADGNPMIDRAYQLVKAA